MYYLGENLIVDYGDSNLWYKSFKISGECIMFIVFEVWKLWLAFDGVKYRIIQQAKKELIFDHFLLR